MKKLSLLLTILFPALVSCSSISVKDVKKSNVPRSKPERIYVSDFDTRDTQVTGKRDSKTGDLKKQASDLLSEAIVKNVSHYIVPAERISSSTHRLPASGWLLKGRFIRISPGNKTLRMGVGLGMGGTKLETEVMVSDLASPNDPFLRFVTTGGSNAMPGLLTSTGPTSAVVSILTTSQTGLADDSARTSRMIAASLGDYMTGRGWKTKSKGLKVKKPGEYQLIQQSR